VKRLKVDRDMKSVVKLAVALLLAVAVSITSQSEVAIKHESADVDSSQQLPNVWEDQTLARMIRDVLVRDLSQEHEQRQLKRQYKREVRASVPAAINGTRPTRKGSTVTTTTQKLKRPQRVNASKTKIRVTPLNVTQTQQQQQQQQTIKPVVKLSMQPVALTTNLNAAVAINASAKVSEIGNSAARCELFQMPIIISHLLLLLF